MDRKPKTIELSRRTFLATTSAGLVGAAWHGLVPHPDAVSARLEKLERQNHRLKLAGACLLILGSSLLLMGALSSPSRTVEAEHFVLRDPRGKVRARLSTIGDSTVLSFNDHNGLIRTSLTIGDDGFPGLVFHDRHGEVRVFLGVVDGEPISARPSCI